MKKITVLLCLSLGLSANALAKGDIDAGKEKSATCMACHGPEGISTTDLYPNLAGQHANYIVKQIKEFQLAGKTSGEEGRNNAVMIGMVSGLSEQDIDDLGAYYASLKGELGSSPEYVIAVGEQLYRGGDEERGITACIACHGPRGDGMSLANFPDISGQKAAYIKSQLEAFRSDGRNNDMNGMMRDIAKRLTDRDIDTLSKYLGGLH